MFEFAFSELVVIMVVALIVIGPERLPKVARAAGLLWGRVQRYVQNVKADIARDMALGEVQQMHDTLNQKAASIEQAAQEARSALEQNLVQPGTHAATSQTDGKA